ncbi:nSTAND1 domain-containing NTPase [Merismopedia glauca]|uniref:CHAT domain-containing protein n=1 Tax=Merismopedia glauca CCAP 1448/3 TaxID=1296344 RepID=A0A2T1BYS4_9CYAN|nr:CHAT domain-containing protein [Merismopedia glauca]PSB01186.1 hypothetical protein C7B64_19660 [Merismopedia glauca CCAP 1448/3]
MDVLTLKLEAGDFDRGFASVTVQIHSSTEKGDNNSIQRKLQLPPAPELRNLYQRWQEPYHNLVNPDSSRGIKKEQRINYSSRDELSLSYQELQQEVNRWLQGLKDELEPVICSRRNVEILFEIQTFEDIPENVRHLIEQLHWEKWNLFPEDAKVGVAFTYGNAIRSDISAQRDGEPRRNKRVRILGILGHGGEGIDLKADEELIRQLPGAEPHFLYEPELSEFQKLWDENWDILFYGGHSETIDEGRTGWLIDLNPRETLDIQKIRQTLKTAIANGLKLAIFSSCDGLGLARQLRDLDLPYIIVWKEPISTDIAKKFLEYFLKAFAKGMIIEKAVWQAQTQLREWSNCERDLPGVTSLIATIRNSAQSSLTWFDLGGIPICPYRGLSAFQEEHAPYFFGRDRFAKTLLEAVRKKPLVAVVGASGSGKSSVVLAGLIPLLRQDKVVQWQVAVFRPGTNPIESLAIALTSVSQIRDRRRLAELELEAELRTTSGLSSAVERIVNANPHKPYIRLVLVADQFEELYTNVPETERHTFIDGLLYAVKSAPSFTLVLTLRGDFYGSAISYPPLSDALQDAVFNLSTMNREELHDAIVCPAEKMRVRLQDGLVDTLIGDLGDSAGRLPLLQFTLKQLWEGQENYTLTHQAYQQIGGLERAIAVHADGVYAKLSEYEREQARRVFIKLVRLGEGTEATRRLAKREEFKEETWDLVRRLANEDARLVVTNRNESTGQETVEIIHEVLIQHWGKLEHWLRENEDFLRWSYRLEDALEQWESHDKQEGYLLREAPLVEAQRWLESRREELTNAQRVFIQSSLELRNRENTDKEKRRRHNIFVLTCFSGVGLLLSVIAGIGWHNAAIRETNAELNNLSLSAKTLIASGKYLDALVESLRAGLKLKQAVNIEAETRMQVLTALNESVYGIREINRLVINSSNLPTLSPDSNTIAIPTGNAVQLRSTDGRLLNTLKGHTSEVIGVVFSADSRAIASISEDSTLKIWSIEGSLLKTMKNDTSVFSPYAAPLIKLLFSPDGKTINLATRNGTWKSWNLDGVLLETIRLDESLDDFLVSSDGQYAISLANNKIGFWSLKKGLLKTAQTNLNHQSLSISPDSQVIGTYGDDSVQIWDTKGILLKQMKITDDCCVQGISFSPDSQTFASISQGDGDDAPGLLQLWSRNGTLLKTFPKQIKGISRVSFSPDGQIIASANHDGTVKLWKANGTLLETFRGHNSRLTTVGFSPDAQIIISTAVDGTMRFWSREHRFPKILKGEYWQNVSFSPDSQFVISNASKIWNRQGSLVKEFELVEPGLAGDTSIVFSPDGKVFTIGEHVSFSPNGRAIISSDMSALKLWDINGKMIKTIPGSTKEDNWDQKTIKLWSLDRGTELNSWRIPEGDTDIVDLTFSPKGKIIIASSNTGGVNVSIPDGNKAKILMKIDSASQVSFSPDGKMIASDTQGGAIKIWDYNGKLLKKFQGFDEDESVGDITFSPDSQAIAVADSRTVRLWSINGTKLQSFDHKARIRSVSFSPDGKILASGSFDGQDEGEGASDPNRYNTVILWNLDLDDLIAQGCNWAQNYLKNNPDVSESDRHLCDSADALKK